MGDAAPSLAGMPEELLDVIRALRHGVPVVPWKLTSALLLAMRRGNQGHLAELFAAASSTLGEQRALEDCLDEAWRTACALNLPLGENRKLAVLGCLTLLRYILSSADPMSDVPTAADAEVRWHELWGRVDLLLEYSRRLQDELERLQGHDRAPGRVDKSVMLARICALAVHGVKGSFLSTYTDVPWEEMEYLLVMFIEAHTVFVTLANLVATATSTAAHLRCFRERLKKYVLVHRAEPDPEAAMRRLKKEPRQERASLLGGVVDSALTDLRKDFALLRDWHSLKEINETLRVTSEALSLEDADWAAWGWLALRWGLFVVGERVKYSWLSPNLSPRFAVLVDTIAPSGVLKLMTIIRNDQEHGKAGSNAKTLALPEMKTEKREKLIEELRKVQCAARVAQIEAESEMVCSDDSDWITEDRVNAAKKHEAFREGDEKHLIYEEVIKLLDPAKDSAAKEFDEIVSLSRPIKNESFHHHTTSFYRRTSFQFCVRVIKFVHDHIPQVSPRIIALLFKSTEHISCFQTDLAKMAIVQAETSQLDTIRKAVNEIPNAEEPVNILALRGAFRELASRWHEKDNVVHMTVPFSPTLFGRQLRNYFNHLDEVLMPSLELRALCIQLRDGMIELGHNGARPRLRGPQWSQDERERLLRLVELKSDMFSCANAGNLVQLQHLLGKDGADVSVRDCQDRTLLHAAAQGGQAHVVRWLLGLGAEAVDPHAGDWYGDTALHLASTRAVAEALFATRSVHWEVAGWSPLHAAARGGRTEVAEVLLRDPRDLNAEQVGSGHMPLHHAALGGHGRMVDLLLQAGARYSPGGEHTPLLLVAQCGSDPAVRLLLGAASPRPSDEDCWEAAQEAAGRRHEQAFSVLLDELSARRQLLPGTHLHVALRSAAFGGSITITLMLLELFPDALSMGLHDSGLTVLHVAAAFGNSGLVRALVDRGADPLFRPTGGATAFVCAAASGSADTIDVLVEHIPPGDVLQAALGEALLGAIGHGQLGAVKRLVHHGAEIDALDDLGFSFLTRAVECGPSEVVEWLLQQGADPRLGKHPPLRAAAGWGRLDVVKMLVPPLQSQSSALKPAEGVRNDDEKRDVLRQKRQEEGKRLGLLQQVGSYGDTALHRAGGSSALPIVEYLLDQEGELLRPIYRKHKNTGVPRQDGITVYARDIDKITALQNSAHGPCAPLVAEALLRRMGDEMWLALGHKSLQEVRGMVVEALEVAATPPDGGPLIRTLCGWISSKGEGLLGAEGLQDIRRRAVAALGSGQDEEWNRVLAVLMPLRRVRLARMAASEAALRLLRKAALLAMSACLQQGARGEMAVQLLCQWLCDLSEATVPEDKLLGMVSEAMLISEGRDRRLFALYSSVMADYFLTRR